MPQSPASQSSLGFLILLTPPARTSLRVLQRLLNKVAHALHYMTSSLPLNRLHAPLRGQTLLQISPTPPLCRPTVQCSAMKSPLLKILPPTVFPLRSQLLSRSLHQPSCPPHPTLPARSQPRMAGSPSNAPPLCLPLQGPAGREHFQRAHQMQRTTPAWARAAGRD